MTIYISKRGERQFSSVCSFAKHREMILRDVVRNCKTRNEGNGGDLLMTDYYAQSRNRARDG